MHDIDHIAAHTMRDPFENPCKNHLIRLPQRFRLISPLQWIVNIQRMRKVDGWKFIVLNLVLISLEISQDISFKDLNWMKRNCLIIIEIWKGTLIATIQSWFIDVSLTLRKRLIAIALQKAKEKHSAVVGVDMTIELIHGSRIRI